MNVADDDNDVIPNSSFHHLYKVMIIGHCGVGKTSLLYRYLYNEFNEFRLTPLDKETKTINIKGRKIDLELWDTAGLETYCTPSTLNLKGTNAVIILYQITDPSTYVEVKDSWLRMVCAQFGEDADQHIPILLVGSKSDLVDKYDDLQVCVRSKDINEDLKHRHSQLLGPIECSSKTGKNVDKVFRVLSEEIIRRNIKGSIHDKNNKDHPHVTKTNSQGSCNC